MTDKVNVFGAAKRAVGYRRGADQVVNLTEMFARHGLNMNAGMDVFPGQPEK